MTKFVTYDQLSQLLDERLAPLHEQAQRPARPHAITGLLSAVVATSSAKLDGQVTLADVFTSFSIAVGSSAIGFVAAGGSILAQWGDPRVLWGTFTLAGCGLGIVRLGIDALALPILWSDFWDKTFDYLEKRNESETPTESIGDGEYGKAITYPKANGWDIVTLLPDVKTALIYEMIRETARLYFTTHSKDGKDKAFSKRKLGKPFGERIGQAQTILKQAGYIKDAANNTYLFTMRGRD